MTKPGALIGALIGVLLTAPLIAVFYLGWKLAGLPFVPFDVFDWVARMLPGSVLTLGIDTMIKVIHTLNVGGTAFVAKTAEQLMAMTGLFVTGVIAGAVLFAILRAWRTGPASLFGIILGTAAGVGAMLIGRSLVGTATTNPLMSALWILGAFVTWGAAFGWVYNRLSVRIDTASPPAVTERYTSVERVDRRQFLIRLGGAAAAITVVGAVVAALSRSNRGRNAVAPGRWSADHSLPNAGDSIQPAPGTRPEFPPLEDHYRIDINLMPQSIREEDWKLAIHGLVERPVDLTLADVRSNFAPLHQFVTLACISNEIAGDLIGTTRWTGVSVRRLLPYLGLRPEATHLKISSVDGFFEVVPLDTIRGDERVMLTYAWDDVPLPAEHGFPLRIYIPDLYGMKQPKWITSIEAIDHWEAGYWVVRGWDREARMKATSVIDTVAVDATTTNAEGQRLVPIGGIAHAGARGISRVEIRIDDAEWHEARLRAPLSGTTWVVWRYDWPFKEGAHTFTVRCYDGSGTLQIAEPSPPHPAGATGLHSRRARL